MINSKSIMKNRSLDDAIRLHAADRIHGGIMVDTPKGHFFISKKELQWLNGVASGEIGDMPKGE